MVIWLIFLPLLALGCALLAMAGRQVGLHIASLSWVPAHGVLLERGVAQEYDPATGNSKIGAASRFTGRFAYEWEGRSFVSEQVSFSLAKSRNFGRFGRWDDRLDEALGEPGGAVSLWVDPAKPQHAVLMRDIRWSEVGLCLGIGLLLLWVGVSVLFGDPSLDPAAFSWRRVGVMWLVGGALAVLVPLLWRDGHPVWAIVMAVPLLLAIHGTVHGLRQP